MVSNHLSISGGPQIEMGYDHFSLPDSVDQVGGRFYQKYGLEVGLDAFQRFHFYTIPGLTVGNKKEVIFSSSSLDFAQGGNCPDEQRHPVTGECVGDMTTGDTSSTVISTHGWDLPLMVGVDLLSGSHGVLKIGVGYAHGGGSFADNYYPVGNVNYELDTLTTYQTNDFQVELAPTYKSRWFDASLVFDGRMGRQKTISVHSIDGGITTQSGSHFQGTAGVTVLFHPARENRVLPQVLQGYEKADQKAQALAKDFKEKYAQKLEQAGIIDVGVVLYSFPKDEEGKNLPSLGIEGWYYYLELTRRNEGGVVTGPASSTDHYTSLEELAQALSSGI